MNKFIEVPAGKQSLSQRKLLQGVGINDADYKVCTTINGKRAMCPYYRKWVNMLQRCYCRKLHKIQPTYAECTVVDGWLTFSVFKEWMKSKVWENCELDKDLLFQGNKTYSPKNCIFVPEYINGLLKDSKASRGDWPQGVRFHKRDKKYLAEISFKNERKHLGSFKTPDEASEVYKNTKYTIIKEVALEQSEPLRTALLNYRIVE